MWLSLATGGGKRKMSVESGDTLLRKIIRQGVDTVLTQKEQEALDWIKRHYNVRAFDYVADWVTKIGEPVEWEKHTFEGDANGVVVDRNPAQAEQAMTRAVRGARLVVNEVMNDQSRLSWLTRLKRFLQPLTNVETLVTIMPPETVRAKPSTFAHANDVFIQYQPEFLKTYPDKDVFNTTLHELAHHLIDVCGMHDLAEGPDGTGHGPLWVALARELGCNGVQSTGYPGFITVDMMKRKTDAVFMHCTHETDACDREYDLITYGAWIVAAKSVSSPHQWTCGSHGRKFTLYPQPGFETEEEMTEHLRRRVESTFAVFRCAKQNVGNHRCVKLLTLAEAVKAGEVRQGTCAAHPGSPLTYSPTLVCAAETEPCMIRMTTEAYGGYVAVGKPYTEMRCSEHHLAFGSTVPELMPKVHDLLKTEYTTFRCGKCKKNPQCVRVLRNPQVPGEGERCSVHPNEAFVRASSS